MAGITAFGEVAEQELRTVQGESQKFHDTVSQVVEGTPHPGNLENTDPDKNLQDESRGDEPPADSSFVLREEKRNGQQNGDAKQSAEIIHQIKLDYVQGVSASARKARRQFRLLSSSRIFAARS